MKKLFLIVLLLFVSSCFLFKQTYQFSTDIQVTDENWVSETLDNMTLDQKIGQMIMPFARYGSRFKDQSGIKKYKELITKYHVGGFVIRSKDVYTTLKNNNELQTLSKIPLLIAQDYETGVGGRTNDGTEFISMMGVGATGNPQYAYEVGKITAIESRALGINFLFYIPLKYLTNHPNKLNTSSSSSISFCKAVFCSTIA